ncbi:retrotransposon protein, putative, ty1-copia subclass [Tanacetum coccineum]
MTGAKFDIEKFKGTGDFGLWRIKMRALLIQHGCEAALEVLPADMEAQTKAELNKKAHSAVILCLGNKVLREVTRETTAISEHIDEFNKIVLDLANIEVKFEDEDLALLLPTSVPASYEQFMDTLLYGREALTLEDAQALLDWIIDSGCSYHMTPRLDILFDFLECDGSRVQLGDNRECKIRGTLEKEGFTINLQSSKVKVITGFRVVLSGIRRDNYVYSLDGHAMRGGSIGAGKAGAVWQEKSRKAHYSGCDRLCSFKLMGSISGGIIRRQELVENQTGRTVKKLRTDNGLEFCNREFDHLCIENGIARHLTVTGTPQQNGIFGCVAYPQDKKGKLEPRAIKCVLLGYLEGKKGCKLYRLDNESPKIVTSWNVVFNESVMYKDTLKDSGAGADKSVEELQVEVELQRVNNHTPEENQTDEEDGDDEDAGDQETNQTPDLTDYQLARDRGQGQERNL